MVTTRSLDFEGFAVLGTSSATRKMSTGQQQVLSMLPGVDIARRLLEAEIRDTPEAVGPPINIIEAGVGGRPLDRPRRGLHALANLRRAAGFAVRLGDQASALPSPHPQTPRTQSA